MKLSILAREVFLSLLRLEHSKDCKYVQDYKTKLDEIGMHFEYRESEGGHTWSNWRVYLSEFIPKLFK